MYEFPFGAGQQLNLNWIINEIITLHKQLDPDYELPNFDTAFPYMNLNTLNLDWILRELKAIKDLAPTEDATLLKMVANALLAETYDATTQYNVDDIVYRDNEKRLFKCITATPAGGEAWDSSKWVEIDVGEVLTDLLVNGGTANAVTNVRYNNHKIQQEINGTYSDVIVIEDTPTDVSDRLPSSKAVYNLNGAINDVQGQISAYVETGNTSSRAYAVGKYLIWKGVLYRVKQAITGSGVPFTPNTNIVATTVTDEYQYNLQNAAFPALVISKPSTWEIFLGGLARQHSATECLYTLFFPFNVYNSDYDITLSSFSLIGVGSGGTFNRIVDKYSNFVVVKTERNGNVGDCFAARALATITKT